MQLSLPPCSFTETRQQPLQRLLQPLTDDAQENAQVAVSARRAPATKARAAAKTLMAEYYARLVFDQALHDRLLSEVLAADPAEPGFTLTNVLAQERAKALVDSGKDYF